MPFFLQLPYAVFYSTNTHKRKLFFAIGGKSYKSIIPIPVVVSIHNVVIYPIPNFVKNIIVSFVPNASAISGLTSKKLFLSNISLTDATTFLDTCSSTPYFLLPPTFRHKYSGQNRERRKPVLSGCTSPSPPKLTTLIDSIMFLFLRNTDSILSRISDKCSFVSIPLFISSCNHICLSFIV